MKGFTSQVESISHSANISVSDLYVNPRERHTQHPFQGNNSQVIVQTDSGHSLTSPSFYNNPNNNPNNNIPTNKTSSTSASGTGTPNIQQTTNRQPSPNSIGAGSPTILAFAGPSLIVRISRVDFLNSFANSSLNNHTSGGSILGPNTNINNGGTRFTIFNPYLLIQYGKLRKSTSTPSTPTDVTDEQTQAVVIFEQRTKVLQNEIFPVWNASFDFPLLLPTTKLSKLLKQLPPQYTSSSVTSDVYSNINSAIDDITRITFKVMNQNRYKKDSVIAISEIDLTELSYLSQDEKFILRMRQPNTPMQGKTDILDGSEPITEHFPILYIDVKFEWNDRTLKRYGDDPSPNGFSKWLDVVTQVSEQESESDEDGEDDIDEDDPIFGKKKFTMEQKKKIFERTINSCEILRMISFYLPKKGWHVILKPDKLIAVSPTQLLHEEVFSDNINIFYVYEEKSQSVLEEMLNNCEKRQNFKVVAPLHTFRMLSHWEGYRFSCFYSLYKKKYFQDVIAIQTKIGLTYILQYVTNCGGINQPVFEKILERLSFLPSSYSKELDRDKVFGGFIPLGWRVSTKDHIITMVSPYQSNSKLKCKDFVQILSYLNNMSLMERVHFILEKVKEMNDFESLEVIKEPEQINIFDGSSILSNESLIDPYGDTEQLTKEASNEREDFEPIYVRERRQSVLQTNTSFVVEDAYCLIFSVKLKSGVNYVQKSFVLKAKNVSFQLHAFYHSTDNSLPSEGAFNRIVKGLKLSE